jgi:hypothetical protein
VEVIEQALSSQPDIIVRARLLQSTSDTASACAIEDIMDSMHDDEIKGFKFRQAFGKALLKMMGSRLDKKTGPRGRRQSRKNRGLRGRTQSQDGYISSDDDGTASKDGGGVPKPRMVVRHSSLHEPASLPAPSNITVEEHDYQDVTTTTEEYTTSLNDSGRGPSRGARPIRNSLVSRGGGGMTDSSHSSMFNDSSTDDRMGNKSNDGYASSDDDNFMNDVAHKSLPGHGYAISDDGSVDSFG